MCSIKLPPALCMTGPTIPTCQQNHGQIELGIRVSLCSRLLLGDRAHLMGPHSAVGEFRGEPQAIAAQVRTRSWLPLYPAARRGPESRDLEICLWKSYKLHQNRQCLNFPCLRTLQSPPRPAHTWLRGCTAQLPGPAKQPHGRGSLLGASPSGSSGNSQHIDQAQDRVKSGSGAHCPCSLRDMPTPRTRNEAPELLKGLLLTVGTCEQGCAEGILGLEHELLRHQAATTPTPPPPMVKSGLCAANSCCALQQRYVHGSVAAHPSFGFMK